MDKPIIFISYSHKNESEKNELLRHLKVLQQNQFIDNWYDDLIKGGEDWEDRINHAMSNASMAIMLISNDFLSSEFILNKEVPFLLKRKAEEGMIIFPIIIRSCPFADFEWLSQLNVRPKNGTPIWKEGYTKEHVEAEFLQIAEDIKAHLKDDVVEISKEKTKTFHTSIKSPDVTAVTAGGILWVANQKQVKLFDIHSTDLINKWPLPNKNWKCFMPQIWNDLLICSDWDGGIYAYKSSGKTRETVIRKPKFDDTPIYKLEVLSEGLFYALAWDGRIFLYSYNDSKDKTEEQQCFSIENLPVKCIPAGEDFLLADQLNHLFLARQSGEIIEILHSRENILDLVTEQNPEGIICFYESKILRYSIQGKELNSLELEDQILLISHRKEDHWTALITSSHKVIWFSWDTFSFIDSEVMEIPFELRKFQCIYDHNNQNSYLALGMTGDDRLITQEGNKLGLGPDIKFQDFFTNRDGRLLFLNSNGTISMQKNPLPLSYEIKLDVLKASLSGELVLNQHHIIGFTIQNSGEIPACKLRVRLNGASPLRDEVQLLLPGEQLILEFSIKANEVGEAIPLALEMIAEDELGMRWSKVDTLYRESKEA